MSSHPMHQDIGYDPQQGGHLNSLPPPPPRDASYSNSLRRQNVLHPTVLTTAISSTQGGSHHSTPLSGISHQSPFSAVAPSPVVRSAHTPIGPSPMASRLSGHFSVPYDPRDWAPGTDTRAAQAQRARDNAAEDGLASPPPPYSPSHVQSMDTRSPRSPRTGLERAQTMSATPSPTPGSSFAQRRMTPASNTPPSNRHSVHMGSYMPPPPPSAAPPMPNIPRSRVVSDMQPGYDPSMPSPEPIPQAPAARRAASASAGPSRVSEAGPSRSISRQRTWVPGMPLPGPPPGPPPPPSSSRSHSTSGAYDRPSNPRARPLRQTIHVSDLGPVPPTPSNWTEGQPLPDSGQGGQYADATSASNSYMSPNRVGAGANQAMASPPANLSRSSAVRDSSAKGLRERRAQSRNSVVLNGDLNSLSVQTNPWADALNSDSSESRHDAPLLSGPRSGRMNARAPSPLAVVTMSYDHYSASPIQLTSTPPMSPTPVPQFQSLLGPRSAGLPAKSLPTPPLSQKAPLSAHSILQSQREPLTIVTGAEDNFQKDATRRHAEFLEKEKSANSDVERLQAFAEYVLQEASIRQKKYERAFASGEFNVEQLRNNLFDMAVNGRSASNSISQVSADGQDPLTGNTTPQNRPETMWWKDYKPQLSPIASMDYDEMSSRGRAPSRWWESQTGSQSGGAGGRTVRRSKRESKYMGLSKEFLMAHSPSEEYPGILGQNIAASTDSYPNEKANPETFGYFEGDAPRKPSAQTKKPETPALLDISRFITLPPPYPRHYPAVNNNHPDLAEFRTTVRTLSDLDEVKTRKEQHRASVENLRAEHKRKISDSRRTFQSNVQTEITQGTMTYGEAAEAEAVFKASEFDVEKQCLQTEFGKLQDSVINPLHDMLHGRIAQLNTSIQKLQDDLHTDARYQDPDQPQEEGDEKPELLEKLTQLKWLFDVREQTHKECFDLLTERNDKYKAIVLLPYQFSMNTEKVRDTETFFNKDAQDRHIVYCNDSLKRHENFLQIVEQHVRRGIELQSSAFWDIAPGLLDLLQKIPEDLRYSQGIQIPDKEYNENPSYHQHPEQYLYSLLSHAEKSTYQFIEGQVNLQCLLHEVRTTLLISRYRALEAHEGVAGSRDHNLSDAKGQEEAALTSELKQKASMIEEQWLEALGSQLQATRERVKAVLQEDDAWEEMAAEDD